MFFAIQTFPEERGRILTVHSIIPTNIYRSTVEPGLSGLVGIGRTSPDNQVFV